MRLWLAIIPLYHDFGDSESDPHTQSAISSGDCCVTCSQSRLVAGMTGTDLSCRVVQRPAKSVSAIRRSPDSGQLSVLATGSAVTFTGICFAVVTPLTVDGRIPRCALNR